MRADAKRRDHDSSRGSLTVEALLFLIPFIMAFCTLINAARFVQAEMLIHHAITQTAKQISTYSYVLTKAKISDRIQTTHRKSEKFLTDVGKATTSIEGFIDAISNRDALVEGVISLAKSEGEQMLLRQVVGMLSKNNIKNEITLMSDDPDRFLRNVGIVDGLSGLDFTQSSWMSKSEGKAEIKIVVSYTMKNILFPDFDFGQHKFRQCAYTLIW